MVPAHPGLPQSKLIMTPDEREFLRSVGSLFISEYLVPLAIRSLLYGILMPIACTIAIRFARIKGQPITRLQLVISLFGIIAFTGFLVAQVVLNLNFGYFFTATSTSLLQRQEQMSRVIYQWDIIEGWFINVAPAINDAFMIWRGWVLFGKQRWALYLAAGLATANLVFTIVTCSVLSYMVLAPGFENGDIVVDMLKIALNMMAFLTNVVATAFIGYRLWIHRRYLNHIVGSQPQRLFRVKHILLLLVDTGLVYGLLQLTLIILSFAIQSPGGPGDIVASTFGSIYYAVSASIVQPLPVKILTAHAP
ncbi:hypothetical protein H0H93_008105 [Arthromyces matolae]|nr:hypothetical protein H0H93_008105 [Arthromyces matolae]